MKKFIFAVLLLVAPAFAVADTGGAVAGAVVGGALGNQVGGGAGRKLATIVLIGAGASIGSRIEDGTYFEKPAAPPPPRCQVGFKEAWAVDPSLSDTRICVVAEEHRATFKWSNGAVCPLTHPIPALLVATNSPRCFVQGEIKMSEQPVPTRVNVGAIAAATKGRADRLAAEQRHDELVAYCSENPQGDYRCRNLQARSSAGGNSGGLFGGATSRSLAWR